MKTEMLVVLYNNGLILFSIVASAIFVGLGTKKIELGVGTFFALLSVALMYL